MSFKHAKAANDFIPGPGSVAGPVPGTWQKYVPGGTTQSSFDIHAVKRLGDALEISADVQHEWWKAPVYQAGERNDTVATFQLTVYPARKSAP